MELIYRQHAVKRMHERCITEEEVEHAITCGTTIESYPDDTPYPSTLLLGHAGTKTIHVVYADDAMENVRIIITVYEPDPEIWHDDFNPDNPLGGIGSKPPLTPPCQGEN